ncbi:hypothetical protein [Neomoorella mulderi]
MYLSIALGIKACLNGYTARFFTAANLVTRPSSEAQTSINKLFFKGS